MTDQKRDPESSQTAPTLLPGPLPGIAELSGLLSSPHDESLLTLGGTALAPSCPASLSTAVCDVQPVSLDDIKPGSRIDDFEIISLLGRGAFGAVYLARQISLERQVALKVTAWQGGEGRKMARLEHENIVQVFSETAFDSRTRLLCMQYVSGPTLQAVLDELAGDLPAERSGQKLLRRGRSARATAGGIRSGRHAKPRIAGRTRLGRDRLLDRSPPGRGPGLRPQPRGDPSRHQAGQHHAQPVWASPAGRFQPGVSAA